MFNSYESPFSNRYSSNTMRFIWSKKNERDLWVTYWKGLLFEHIRKGIITNPGPGSDWVKSPTDYTEEMYQRELVHEEKTKHDLVACLKVVMEDAPEQIRGVIHLASTSSDVEDYADSCQILSSFSEIDKNLKSFMLVLADFVGEYAGFVTMGYTHLQPAEPTTLGYRFAVYLQEIQASFDMLEFVMSGFRQKDYPGGAVGTRSNEEMLESRLEHGSWCYGQTFPRTQEVRIASCYMSMASTFYKMAMDYRMMQSQGTLWEGKGDDQIGSSAMPSKSNPITAEKICSLSRSIPGIVRNLWDASAHSILERTLDDSAVRRTSLPELFLTMQEIVTSATNLIKKTEVQNIDESVLVVNMHWKTWMRSRTLTLMQKAVPGSDRWNNVRLVESMTRSELAQNMDAFLGVKNDGLFLETATNKALRLAKKVRALWANSN